VTAGAGDPLVGVDADQDEGDPGPGAAKAPGGVFNLRPA